MEDRNPLNPFDTDEPYAPRTQYTPEHSYAPQQSVPEHSYAPQQGVPEQPFVQPQPYVQLQQGEVQNPFAPQQPYAPQQSVQQPNVQPQPFMPQQPYTQQQTYVPQDAGYGAPGYNPYLVQYEPQAKKESYAMPEPGRKSRLKVIISLTLVVLLAGTAGVLWYLGFFHSKNGTYVWDDYQVFGMYAEIEIDGDTAKITMNSNGTGSSGDTNYKDVRTIQVDVEFDGDEVKFSKDDTVLVCKYDRKNQRITAKDDAYVNADMQFEKK